MADAPGSKRSHPVVIDLTEGGDASNDITPPKRPRTSPNPPKSKSPIVQAPPRAKPKDSSNCCNIPNVTCPRRPWLPQLMTTSLVSP